MKCSECLDSYTDFRDGALAPGKGDALRAYMTGCVPCQSRAKRSVGEFPEHHRMVFVLREVDGCSYKEITRITDTNLGTVKSRLNRARNDFARIVAPMIG